MAIAEKLFPGSFKGVRFLAVSFSTTGGRKVVKHRFPNSDKQVIEDLGLEPRSYSMQIIVSDKDGAYLQNRDRLISTFEDKELGKLVHPMYGDIENIKVSSYTLNEDLTELGDGKISVTFEVSNGTGIPEQSGNTLSIVESSNTAVAAAVNTSFAENYETTVNAPNSYNDSLQKLNNSVTAFEQATDTAQAAADKINAFNAELIAFQNAVTSLVGEPQELVDSINNLFSTINGLYPTIDGTIRAMESFFIFGDTDVPLPQTTPSRIERTKNRVILNDSIQSVALSYSYLNSSQLTFNTVGEIEQRANELETQYKKLSASDGLNDDAKQTLADMRVSVQAFFEEQKLTASQVIQIDTNLIPARVLAYQYYGSSEKGEQLSELNETSEPSFLEGTVNILTS